VIKAHVLLAYVYSKECSRMSIRSGSWAACNLVDGFSLQVVNRFKPVPVVGKFRK